MFGIFVLVASSEKNRFNTNICLYFICIINLSLNNSLVGQPEAKNSLIYSLDTVHGNKHFHCNDRHY